MKLQTTTTASLSRFKRVFTGVGISFVIAFVSVVGVLSALPASADEYDDRIRVLQADMVRYQAEADRLNGKAVTLANALAQITNEKNALQAQIDLSQSQYDELVVEITTTKKEIKDNQDGLGTTLADLYVDGDISPIEMLASSQNISDFLNKQEYRNSIRDQLSTTIKTVKDLKAKLTQQKADVEKVLAEQKTAHDGLVAKENEQARLLNKTKNNEATYQGLIADSATKIAQARATQAALSQKSISTGGYNLAASGLLPQYITDSQYGSWNNSNCPMVYTYMSSGGVSYSSPPYNGEDGRGYGCRQCASYVAWKINQQKGFYPSWGNAANFGSHGSASSPRAGTVAVLYDGGPGHVAWVETDPYISTTGSLRGQSVIMVSQYNFNYGQGYGMYSLMELSVNFFDTYRSL